MNLSIHGAKCACRQNKDKNGLSKEVKLNTDLLYIAESIKLYQNLLVPMERIIIGEFVS